MALSEADSTLRKETRIYNPKTSCIAIFGIVRYLDPIFRGDYPAVMRTYVGDRLPVFTPTEVASLNGSLDFVGLNHYTTRFISNGTRPANLLTSDNWQDQAVKSSGTRRLLII